MSESAGTDATMQGTGAAGPAPVLGAQAAGDDPGERIHVLERAAASVPATQWSTDDLLDFLGDELRIEGLAVHDLEGPRAHSEAHAGERGVGVSAFGEAAEADVGEGAADVGAS